MKRILILRGQILFNFDAPSGIRSLCFLRDFSDSEHEVTLCQVAEAGAEKYVRDQLPMPQNGRLSFYTMKKGFWLFLNRVDVRIERWFVKREFNCLLRNWFLLRYVKRTFKPGDFDCIVTSLPDWGMLPVTKKAAEYLKVPWVVDYRDTPDLFDPQLKNPYFRCQVEWCSRYSQFAEFAVTVTEPLMKCLKDRYKIKDVHLVLNGYDGEIKDTSRDPIRTTEKFKIVYAGTMTYGRSLSAKVLFEGLDSMIDRGIDVSNLEVVFLGWAQEELIKDCGRYKSFKLACLMGRLPRPEVLEIEEGANLLLSIASPEVPGVLTSKVFEFAMMGVPILNIPSKSDLVADFVKNANVGYSCESGEEVCELLDKLMNEWSISGGIQKHCAPNREYLRGFSRKEQDKRFLALIDNMLAKRIG